MVKTREEILNEVRIRVGDDTSDEALAFIENVTDTLDDMQNRIDSNGDWKTKYEANDKEWRKKYADRFFEGGVPDPHRDEPPDDDKPTKFEDLFKTE